MTNKKLSAEELFDKLVMEEPSIGYTELMEAYASHVLEAYKAEQKQRLELIDRYAHEIMMDNDQFTASTEYLNAVWIRKQVHDLTKKESDNDQ